MPPELPDSRRIAKLALPTMTCGNCGSIVIPVMKDAEPNAKVETELTGAG